MDKKTCNRATVTKTRGFKEQDLGREMKKQKERLRSNLCLVMRKGAFQIQGPSDHDVQTIWLLFLPKEIRLWVLPYESVFPDD